jgi:Cellobiose phosphorylase
VDLVIWNEDQAGYRQLLHEQIMRLVAVGTEVNATDRPGGIFVRPSSQISKEDRLLFQAVSRVIINDRRGTLVDHLKQGSLTEGMLPAPVPPRTARGEAPAIAAKVREDLMFGNGLGGFTPDGREYIISTARDR